MTSNATTSRRLKGSDPFNSGDIEAWGRGIEKVRTNAGKSVGKSVGRSVGKSVGKNY